MVVLSLDFGGTKLAAGLVEIDNGHIYVAHQCPTPDNADESYTAMLDMAHHLQGQAPEQPIAVGVGFGGLVETNGRNIRYSMHVCGWKQAALADWLERDLSLPCAIANDADAATLAEQRYGAGQNISHLLYMTISTGIGGGIIIDNTIYRGAHAWAGEIGHQALDLNGPPCACGRHGCLEALASGRGIARSAKIALNHLRQSADDTRAKTAFQRISLLDTLPIEQITAKTIAEAVAAGDPLASTVWDRAMTWLGIGIANVANIINPTRVVLGGGVTRAGALLFDPVRRVVAQRALDPALEVMPSALGEHVGLLGAALIAPITTS